MQQDYLETALYNFVDTACMEKQCSKELIDCLFDTLYNASGLLGDELLSIAEKIDAKVLKNAHNLRK